MVESFQAQLQGIVQSSCFSSLYCLGLETTGVLGMRVPNCLAPEAPGGCLLPDPEVLGGTICVLHLLRPGKYQEAPGWLSWLEIFDGLFGAYQTEQTRKFYLYFYSLGKK